MVDLKYLINEYSSNYINSDELIHLKRIKKFKDWQSKTDIEKQALRKSYLQMLEIHFEEEDIEYIKQVVLVTDKILSFLEELNYSEKKINSYSKLDTYFYRIYNMLWCEKEYVFFMESIRATRIHISLEVFIPLIEKVKHTKRYSDYKLDSLFKEYKKMILLFDELILKG